MAAPILVVTTIYDSRDFIVIKVVIPTGGNLDVVASRILNLTTFTTDRTPTSLKIVGVAARLANCTAILYQDATVDVHLLSITDGMNASCEDFPIPLTAAAGTTGDLLLSTHGIGLLGVGAVAHGHITIRCRKI